MKKQLGILLFTLLLILGMTLSASAASMPRLVDGADLLSDSEEAELLSMLDEISARQMLDVVIVTTNTLEGKSAMAYADDFFDYNGYGFGSSYDGVLLLVSMEDRDWWISTSGYGITAFTDYGITCLSDQFLPRNGTPFDVGSEPFDPGSSFLIAAVIGLIAALIVVSSMKAQLKSVRQQNAGSYLKDGSFQLTESREMFLYRNVHRTVKQESSSGGSSTHRSSSGRSHGGGGGKF